MFLGIIGGLTLFVGGMGVANIMYAVVKERNARDRREDGAGGQGAPGHVAVRARGADHDHPGRHPRHLVGVTLMQIIAVLPLKGDAFEFLGRPTFSPAIAAATSLILGTVGLLAGYFPARRAASVNPAESLRYE
jgi:putative ABC transport system permease protein